MTISITFPAEIETTLRRQAAATGKDLATYVQDVVTESLVQDDLVQDDEAVPVRRPSPAEFAQRLESWIALHPILDHAIDDSRESIYAGRGE